jgi:predicted nucleic acid-binding protein
VIAKENSIFLFDTSALLTLIEDEPGADRVAHLLRSHSVLLPFMSALETYYITLQERNAEEAERRLFLLRQLPLRWLETVDEAVLKTAARFKAQHRLSLADCLIAAFAHEGRAILVHKDPEYEALTDLPQEVLPLKRT